MMPSFEIGEEVMIIDRENETVSGPYTVSGVFQAKPEFYVYSLYGHEGVVTEDKLCWYDPMLVSYEDYFIWYIDEDGTDSWIEENELINEGIEWKPTLLLDKPKEYPSLDEYLDAYNTLNYLSKTIKSRKYKSAAKELLQRLKDGEREIDLDKYTQFIDLEEEA
jgi:hypothetical protein